MTGKGGLNIALRGDENPKPINSGDRDKVKEGEKLEHGRIKVPYVSSSQDEKARNK